MRNVCGAFFIVGILFSCPVQGVQECTLTSSGNRIALHKKVEAVSQIERAWELIKLTRSGRQLVERIAAIKDPEKLWKFLPLTDAITVHGFAAFCSMSGDATTIYLDENSSLGVLAVFLFHESFHGLDQELRDGQNENTRLQSAEAAARQRIVSEIAARAGVPEAKLKFRHFSAEDHQALADLSSPVKEHTNRITLRSERLAYDAQWEFLQELKKLGDCVEPYFEEQASLKKVLNYNPSDEQLRAHYEK